VDISPVTPFVLVGVFALATVLMMVLGYAADRRRRGRLIQFSAEQGWEYLGTVPDLAGRWTGPPFGQGERRRIENVMRGMHCGRTVTAFDYTFETHGSAGSGRRHSTTHRYVVAVLGLPASLGTVEVTPDNILLRLGTTLGLGKDLRLESEDFNRRFWVRASNPKLASDVLHPGTMQLLLAFPRGSWRIDGDELIGWQTGTIEPDYVLSMLRLLTGVADGVPEFVWKDHGYDPQADAASGDST
jgi:hypothetical protein